jgi:hypothetical protein
VGCGRAAALFGQKPISRWLVEGGAGDYGSNETSRPLEVVQHAGDILCVIPHHETFSTTIQSPYSSTKGWII